MEDEVQVQHIKAYVTKSSIDTSKAVVVLQDIFVWQVPNTRYMADMIAGNGYTTIVPAFFVDQEEWMKDNHKPLPKPEVLGTTQNPGIVRYSQDVHSLKNPTLFIFAENDAVIPLEQVALLTQKLKEHCQVEYQIKIFSGQTHGFVHRKKEACSPEDKPYIDEAGRNLIEWLNKYF
ncbi:hypothetical protein MC885_003108 [Smutsia gigantea]|nr:hypothetical protein MC885_003108 [Smutsia gigantea]